MILRVAVFAPVAGTFDYLPGAASVANRDWPGMRVLVPFGRTARVGVVIECLSRSPVDAKRLRSIRQVLDDATTVGRDIVALAQWAAAYYRHPLGEVIATALPGVLRRQQRLPESAALAWRITERGRLALAAPGNRAPRQRLVLERIAAGQFNASARDSIAFDWRRPLRELVHKGVVEVVTAAPEQPPAAMPPLAALTLAAQQQAAVDAIIASLGSFVVWLLRGVTGSGKTEVYLRAAAAVLDRGQQVLILVPEIGLTEQFVARVADSIRYPVTVVHSGLNEGERYRAWHAAGANRPQIILGTRSAIWAPCPRLGLIVIDEEHDPSFKQGEGLRYSARDTAIVRARSRSVPVILGSATPSLESLLNTQRGRYRMLALPERAGGARPPAMRLVDLRGAPATGGISPELARAIADRVARHEQTLLFLNRRGYAPVVLCHQCGWSARCPRCTANLVYHKQSSQLICHHCGTAQDWRGEFDCCSAPVPVAVGSGTERIEEALQQLFPGARIARIDRDTTRRKGSRATLFDAMRRHAIDILIGTQMIAKGHHFPAVTLVGIVDADNLLYSGDFRATERLAQQIVQVAGRAGRAQKPGEVVIQTHHPQHPLLQMLLLQGYDGFAQQALLERHSAALPPFAALALLRADAALARSPQAFLDRCAVMLRRAEVSGVAICGPVPAPMERRAGRFRWQLLLAARSRGPLTEVLNLLAEAIGEMPETRRVRWSLDVDPVELW